ncbi:MAG: hypothetical protein HY788_01775 [Deltaproteobacteria bacterium]|nr:hypothetical protein [Deltaproteobacteria bacterium]
MPEAFRVVSAFGRSSERSESILWVSSVCAGDGSASLKSSITTLTVFSYSGVLMAHSLDPGVWLHREAEFIGLQRQKGALSER